MLKKFFLYSLLLVLVSIATVKPLANEALSADIRIDSIQTSGITDDSQISDTTESEAAKQVIDHKKS